MNGTIERLGGRSSGPLSAWTISVHRDGEEKLFGVTIVTTIGRDSAWVSGTITTPDGERHEFRGEGPVTRRDKSSIYALSTDGWGPSTT